MSEPGRLFREWASSLGLTYKIKAAFGAPDILVLCDPGGISHILQKHIYDYHHSRVVRPRVARLLGKGLGWVEGEGEHRRMRRLVSAPFS
jgi:cytochrome P450